MRPGALPGRGTGGRQVTAEGRNAGQSAPERAGLFDPGKYLPRAAGSRVDREWRFDVDRIEENRMSKSKDTKKDQKKAPLKTAKEKKQAKRDKQTNPSPILSKTSGG
ncbi:MAG: hypothetical protein IPL03_00360 [Sterolibacteriaceae bacterium]|nr:hypothetical protein [Candidatus Methylophosphatis haderslevensis]